MANIELLEGTLVPAAEPADEATVLAEDLELLEEHIRTHPDLPASFRRTLGRETGKLTALTTPPTQDVM